MGRFLMEVMLWFPRSTLVLLTSESPGCCQARCSPLLGCAVQLSLLGGTRKGLSLTASAGLGEPCVPSHLLPALPGKTAGCKVSLGGELCHRGRADEVEVKTVLRALLSLPVSDLFCSTVCCIFSAGLLQRHVL